MIPELASTVRNTVYEGGLLRPLQPLPLPEHTQVRISVETLPIDAERTEWLNQSKRRLLAVWDNDADDVYNELLSRVEFVIIVRWGERG